MPISITFLNYLIKSLQFSKRLYWVSSFVSSNHTVDMILLLPTRQSGYEHQNAVIGTAAMGCQLVY